MFHQLELLKFHLMWSIYLLLEPTQYTHTLLKAQQRENVQCILEVNTKQWGQPAFNVYFKIICLTQKNLVSV